MSYMNDGCDPFGIPYIEYDNKKTVKKERDKPIERFTYNGCIIYDNINNERMEVWETAKSLNQLNDENEQLKTTIQQLRTDNTKQKKKLNTTMKENEQLKEESEVCKQAYDEIKSDAINLKKENEELKSLIKALKKSNTDYIHQIKKAYDEKLSFGELANNCGVDLE